MGVLPRALKAAVLLLAALAVSSCVTPLTGAPPQATPALLPDYAWWPHEGSDLKPDPGIRYGVLPNGVRYAIMRAAQPAGAVSLRLRIAAGSLQEEDDQRGLAHFLEHMAFNGSKNVPEGEFVKLLQRKGLAFGAHTNAYTSTSETVYMLELPKNTADLVDTGLMLFREVAGNLSLDQKAIDREKGVVLSELRSRNTPEYRAFETRWKRLYEGQRLADRLPIGLKDTIAAATRERLLEYYQRNYRPERAMIVVVGDIDVNAMEAELAGKFADWRGQGADRRDADMQPPRSRGLTPALFVEKNLPETITVNWLAPAGRDVDTIAARTRDARWWMANTVINRRLERIARAKNAPFISAAVNYNRERAVVSSYSLSVSSTPGTWRTALSAAEQELRRALEHGFTADEIARELKDWQAGLEDAAGSAGTRKSADIARTILSSFDEHNVATDPATELAVFNRYAPTLTPKAVLAGLREVAAGAGPVVVLSTGQDEPGGVAAIAEAWRQSTAMKVAPQAARVARAFPYESFGRAGEVAERRVLDDIGVTLIRFGNGVRLNVKQTDFEKDTIGVNVRFGGGFLSLPRDKVGLYWLLPFAFAEGGLKRLTTDELEEALAGRIVSMDAGLDEDAFEFGARTNRRDLALQMQLFAAYATDAAYRPEGLARLMASAEADIRQFASSPGRVLSREISSLLRSRDARWQFPDIAQLKAIDMRAIEAVMAPALASAPVEIGIVGDITEEEAVRAVAATFGALGPRPVQLAVPTGARDVKFPAGGGRYRFTHEGAADQALAFLAWRGPDFYANPREARTLSLLREVLKVRLVEEFREAQGATYSPSAGSSFSSVFPGFGFISASAETRPELVDGFFTTLDRIVAEIVAGRLSDDTIGRAREPLVKNLEKSRLGNGYWSGAIGDLQADPRGVEAIRTQIGHFQAISRDEIVRAAARWLRKDQRIEVRILPQDAAGAPAAAPKTP